jgi:hypothetical protein
LPNVTQQLSPPRIRILPPAAKVELYLLGVVAGVEPRLELRQPVLLLQETAHMQVVKALEHREVAIEVEKGGQTWVALLVVFDCFFF